MNPVHRPLSAWVAYLATDTGKLGPINDGDERADARHLDEFAGGWSRIAVSSGQNGSALGLAHNSGAVVVELDDYGRPIPISPGGVAHVAQVEQTWPEVQHTEAVLNLRDESLPLRYWLLERLSAEGQPPDEAFAILPWDLLTRAIDSVAQRLRSGVAGERVEIRHWLTPAVHGLTGALEQLDHGLRSGDDEAARLGAAALRDFRLGSAAGRLPDQVRWRFAQLRSQIAKSPLAVARDDTGSWTVLTSWLNPNLEAAASDDKVRTSSDTVEAEGVLVRVTTTQAGVARVTARIEQAIAEVARAGTFLTVVLRPRSGGPDQQFLIAQYREADHLAGSIEVPLPQGDSQFGLIRPVVFADNLGAADPHVLLTSVRASSALSLNAWYDVADGLPADHPVRRAVQLFEDSSGQ